MTSAAFAANPKLMQCFTDAASFHGCDKWYHAHCVDRLSIPEDDWLCKDCANEARAVGQKAYGIEGCTLRLDVTPETELDDSDSERTTTVVEDDKYMEMTHSDHHDTEDEEFDDTLSPKKNNKAVKKPGSKNSKQMVDDADDESWIEIDNKPAWKVHAAGAPPETARQQQDSKVRTKVKNIRKTMETLQKQSTPYTRSDEYESGDDEQPELNQKHWPWVVHGACCLTDMANNDDGTSEASFVKKPILHMWVGSAKNAAWTADHIKESKIKLHTSFEHYIEAFQSESGKKKQPPKIMRKTTKHTIKKTTMSTSKKKSAIKKKAVTKKTTKRTTHS